MLPAVGMMLGLLLSTQPYSPGSVPLCLPKAGHLKVWKWQNEPSVVFQWCLKAPLYNDVVWWTGKVDPVLLLNDFAWSTRKLSAWQGWWRHNVEGQGIQTTQLMGFQLLRGLWLPHVVNGKVINPPPDGWPPLPP